MINFGENRTLLVKRGPDLLPVGHVNFKRGHSPEPSRGEEIKVIFAPVVPMWNIPITTATEFVEGRPFGDISGKRTK